MRAASCPCHRVNDMTTTPPDPERMPSNQRLLIICAMLLIAGFLAIGYHQSQEFKRAVVERPQPDLDKLFGRDATDSLLAIDQRFALEQWRTLALLEQEIVARRYEQAGLLLISRILVKYLGLATGMIMAIAGSLFIIGRIREETTRVDGHWQQAKVAVRSSSPGILFGLMGAVLLGLTIVHHRGVHVNDVPLYLHPANTYLIQPGHPPLDGSTVREMILNNVDRGEMNAEQNIPFDSIPDPK